MIEENVVVLLSTYNGLGYIKEQLDSIVGQDYDGNILIQVRDDGSQDDTVGYISNYIESNIKSENRRIILERGENLGPQKSFLALIRSAKHADFYFFADQDDVWDRNKVKIAVSSLKKFREQPAVYCSNYRLSSSTLDVYKEKAIEVKPHFSPLKVIFYNQIPGCTMAFNKTLMIMLKRMQIRNCMMHDSLVLSFACLSGTVIYDDNSRIYHRIHESNVVGTGHKKIYPFQWLKEKIFLIKNGEDYDLSLMGKEFLKVVNKEQAENNYYRDIQLLATYKDSFYNTLKLLRHPDSHDKIFDRTTLSIRSKILLRLF